MPHSFHCNWQHIVFSTKERRNLLPDELRPKLWPYMAGVAKNHGMSPVAIGGVANHVHLLIGIPGTMPVAKAVQMIKANSSRWIGEHVQKFSWQEGGAAFSVSASNVPTVA